MRDGVGRIQTILVMGGSSQIGNAIVAKLARAGTNVVLAGRDARRLEEAAGRLEKLGATVHVVEYRAEMSGTEVNAVFDQAAKVAGDIDLVVVSIGVLPDESALALDTDATEASLRANFVGPALAAQVCSVRLAAQGHGVGVVLSSVAGLRMRVDLPTYSAGKSGLDAYCRALNVRMRGSGARLLVVRPGQVRTRMTVGVPEAPFTVDPEAVADATVRQLHGSRSVIYVPAALGPVTAVLRMLPGPVFRRLTSAARRREPTANGRRPT
jgi:decaprenylphospho-beta-D-erythro-pentofuranosid-2-ulose 2-reductase